MARQTAGAYLRLPPDVRTRTAIFANDYGQAAAIDFYGPALGLPSAVSNDVTYWLWGPRGYTGESVIVLGSDGEGDRAHFGHVETAGRVQDSHSRPVEWFTIYMCQDFRMAPDLAMAWAGMRRWQLRHSPAAGGPLRRNTAGSGGYAYQDDGRAP